MSPARIVLVFCMVLGSIACSSSSSSSSSGGGSVTGTIFGSPFTPTSAFASVGADGSVDLIFTSTADACGDAKTGTLRAGGIYVQLYGLTKQPDGSWANATDPGDTKAAQIDPTCQASGIKGTRASSAVVHIDSTAGPVTGSLDITFADQSTFAGTFSVPTCSSSLTDAATCK